MVGFPCRNIPPLTISAKIASLENSESCKVGIRVLQNLPGYAGNDIVHRYIYTLYAGFQLNP